jgi:hypothetical protein
MWSVVCAMGALALAGCQSEVGTPFAPEEQAQAVDQAASAQAAAGARADATFLPQHFDGAALNTLGLAKLGLILEQRDAAQPVVVFLDMPDDATARSRRSAVEKQLKESAVGPAFEVRMGANPAAVAPAAGSIQRQARTESAGEDEQRPGMNRPAGSGGYPR